jgi:hypothetical protein
MKYYLLLTMILALPISILAQDTLYVPVDIVYRAETKNYYVSNSVEGHGNILKLDTTGQVVETFFSDLHFPGGLCLVDGVLFVGDNYGKWNDNLPSYLVGIDINTGLEVMNLQVASTSTYLDMMTSDSSGNIYIGDSGTGLSDGKVRKFNMQSQSFSDLVTETTRPYGVCYDHINDRIIFIESSPSLSFLKSISPDGGEVTKVFYMNQRINGVIMRPNGTFFMTSWGTDNYFGDESVYMIGNSFDWSEEISTGHNRPFGMCIGKDNVLVVCNWGEHSLSFIDLNMIGIYESTEQNRDFTLYPNPANDKVYLKINNTGIKEMVIIIHDILGKEVYRQKIKRNDLLSEKEIDLNKLPEGTYIVNFFSGNKVSYQRLILY